MVINTTNKLFKLKDFVHFSDTFIETGTAVGDGVQRALNAGFKTVLSIEAKKEYWEISANRFYNNNNVKIYYGLSTDCLLPILTKPSVILLDAHPAGAGTFNHDEWEKTKENFQHNTILAELGIILKHYTGHVIIIDDANGINPQTESYMNILFSANRQYKFYFFDENLTGKNLYKNKLLVAIP